jgi:predicted transposase/invertase (TIGR01784 family)
MADKKTKNSSKKNKNLPHDGLFKRILANDLAAREFLEEYLPTEIESIIDLNKITVEKESYIEPNLTKRLSDIVYKVKTKNKQDAFIYLLAEHQSSVDKFMAFRLMKYTLLLAERHVEKKEKIPLIFPIVLYAGSAKYTAARNLWSLFQHPEMAKSFFTEDHALIDLQAMSDDEITKKKHIALFEYIMKHVRMRDMLKLWQNLFEKLPDAVIMDKKNGYFYISNLLWYVDRKLSDEKRDELSDLIIEHLPKNDGDKLMRTIADAYIEEGVNKGVAQGIVIGEARGVEKGIERTAINMLRQKLDQTLISSVTGLSIDEILQLKSKL